MALFVSEERIDRWFDPNEETLVRKGFEFWFQNPLWNKNVPQGFSLCPMFWMSMASYLVFKPVFWLILFPISMVCKGFVNLFGGKFAETDKIIYTKLKNNNFTNLPYSTGKGFGIGFFIIFMISMLVLLTLALLFLLVLPFLILATTTLKMAYLGIITLIPLSVAALEYTRRNPESKFKPVYWLVVPLVAYMTWFYFIDPTGFMDGMNILAQIPLAIWSFVQFLGNGIVYLAVGFFNFIANGRTLGALALYFLLWGAICFMAFFLVERTYKSFYVEKLNRKLSKEEIVNIAVRWATQVQINGKSTLHDTYYATLVSYEMTILFSQWAESKWAESKGEYLSSVAFKRSVDIQGLEIMTRWVVGQIIKSKRVDVSDITYGDFIEFRKTWKHWQNINSDMQPSPEGKLYNLVEELWVEAISMSKDNRSVEKAMEQDRIFKKLVFNYFDYEFNRLLDIKRREEEKAAKHKDFVDSIDPITEWLVSTLEKVFHVACLPFLYVWEAMKQIGNFFVCMFVVLKKKKEGVCPYRYFEPADVARKRREEEHNAKMEEIRNFKKMKQIKFDD